MTNEEIRARLSDELGAQFETREQGHLGRVLFLALDPKQRGLLRLWITSEALAECRSTSQMDEPLNCAITFLREDGGDVTISGGSVGALVAVQESLENPHSVGY
jgi:hypothetical protein